LRYLFEDFVLDTGRRELRRDNRLISVAPQVFDLLAYLICRRERVVTKDDLVASIWKGRAVSDSALTTRINAARVVVGDSGEGQRLIKTLVRKGVRFVGEVQEQTPAPEARVVAERPAGSGPVPTEKPSIAVLPFNNMSGDAEQVYFADGMAEDITTALSKVRWLSVAARNSAFAYKGEAVDVRDAGRELGARYVLEGSVRKAGSRVRITAQLLDSATGLHVWAERYDRELADTFAVQDDIAEQVVAAIEPRLYAAEGLRTTSCLRHRSSGVLQPLKHRAQSPCERAWANCYSAHLVSSSLLLPPIMGLGSDRTSVPVGAIRARLIEILAGTAAARRPGRMAVRLRSSSA
jgi:TolB-like protein